MLQIIVLLLGIYNTWQVIGSWRGMREFGLSSFLWVIWLLSAVAASAAALLLLAPGIAPSWSIFQLPASLQWFVLAIVMGLAVKRKLEVLGTARTKSMESIASTTMWLAIVNL